MTSFFSCGRGMKFTDENLYSRLLNLSYLLTAVNGYYSRKNLYTCLFWSSMLAHGNHITGGSLSICVFGLFTNLACLFGN